MNNELSRNKTLYRIFLTLLRYVPVSLSLVQIVLLTLNYLGIKAMFLTYLGGNSLIFIIMLFILSYIFKFCNLFRIPLIYNTTIICISFARTYGMIPIDLIDLYRIYTILSGLFIFIYIIIAYKTRNNPKIDYIKELCKRYGCCS